MRTSVVKNPTWSSHSVVNSISAFWCCICGSPPMHCFVAALIYFQCQPSFSPFHVANHYITLLQLSSSTLPSTLPSPYLTSPHQTLPLPTKFYLFLQYFTSSHQSLKHQTSPLLSILHLFWVYFTLLSIRHLSFPYFTPLLSILYISSPYFTYPLHTSPILSIIHLSFP